MVWGMLFIAGILEVVWAYYMKQSAGFTRLIPSLITLVTMIASFTLLAWSMKTLPLGTVYVIWTGIGAVGTFLVGIIFLGESADGLRILAVLLIVSGLLLMRTAAS
ncbi:MAG: SMR family transporter [Neisseria sp.]|nr:SMR family transporter [Neisseria sp.]